MTPAFDFRLPSSFDPREFLRTPQLCRLADDARYFISLIITKLARGAVDDCGSVRLHAAYLRNVMHKHHYAAVVDALLDGGAVTRAPYRVGEKSFGYALSDRYHLDKHVRIPATDPRLIGRLESFHKTTELERCSRMLPVHFGLERQQRRLRIDGNLAREIISDLPPESNPYDVQGVLVADIEQREFHVNVGKYGRLTNNVTSMKREVRAALRVRGEPLQHVDIACCQPALVGKAATGQSAATADGGTRTSQQGTNSEGSIYDAPVWASCDDWEAYCHLVQTGTFYEFLLSQLKNSHDCFLTRDKLKRRFLADVIAKKKANDRGAEYPSVVEDCFRALFPSVYRFIRQTNRDGWEHANLIRELQRQESKLVIEIVAANLLARHPRLFVLTLHDAIFATERGIPTVERAFQAAFEQSDFPMTLKVVV